MRVSIALVAVIVTALTVQVSHAPAAPQRASGAHPVGHTFGQQRVGTVGHNGRWLVDAQGRVLLPHGVNLVAKQAPYYPSAGGFGEDDAVWLKDNGFDVVRLGLTATGLMPTPGHIDNTLLDRYAATVDMLAAHKIYVLVDLHQDGWGERANGQPLGSDGFPEWMTLTKGALNTHTGFPLYYVTNPAIQQAFQSLWDNDLGPDGVPLQATVATMFGALATRFADNPWVLGYDVFNEPWPGVTWSPCLAPTGCPDLEHAYLDALYAEVTPRNPRGRFRAARVRRAVRAVQLRNRARVLRHAGRRRERGHELPHVRGERAGARPHHERARLVESNRRRTAEHGVGSDDRSRDHHPPGGTPRRRTHPVDVLELRRKHREGSRAAANRVQRQRGRGARALRPHAVAVAGTPISTAFDPSTRAFEFRWGTTGVNHGHFPPIVTTSISVPRSIY